MEGRKDHAQVTVLLELDINDSEMIQGLPKLFKFSLSAIHSSAGKFLKWALWSTKVRSSDHKTVDSPVLDELEFLQVHLYFFLLND